MPVKAGMTGFFDDDRHTFASLAAQRRAPSFRFLNCSELQKAALPKHR
jgi:hypothetical protein